MTSFFTCEKKNDSLFSNAHIWRLYALFFFRCQILFLNFVCKIFEVILVDYIKQLGEYAVKVVNIPIIKKLTLFVVIMVGVLKTMTKKNHILLKKILLITDIM